jgi:selenocysteine-specific elongation factor
MIIGTAGHIDHGKTSLVKALTGVDADRLPEEKARGITLDLGFAYTQLASGQVLGFVDVPGHEKLVHNMLAGAGGIDCVLLVIAADDGPMPQTVEHLEILNLLGLDRGAIVMTKIDAVPPGRVEEVRAAIADLVSGTGLANAPLFPVSSTTGAGVAQLRDFLEQFAAAPPPRPQGANFRLAVDRAFSLTGIGTVVTGAIHAGTIAVGDEVIVSPRAIRVHVRGLHAQDRPAQQATVGQRCALNLAAPGFERSRIVRGDWVLHPALHAPVMRFDARLRSPQGAPAALRHWAPAQCFLGAARVGCRVALLEAERLEPGGQMLAQIVLEREIGALAGDRFVLRDAGLRRNLAGGTVIDPFPPARGRRTAARLAVLRVAALLDPAAALSAALEAAAHGVDLRRFALAWNRPLDAFDHVPGTRIVAHGATRLAFGASTWADLRRRMLHRVEEEHERAPDMTGVSRERLRRMVAPAIDPAVIDALVEELTGEELLQRAGVWIHLPGHEVSLDPGEEKLWSRVRPLLERAPFNPPRVRDLGRELNVEENAVRVVLKRSARIGTVYPVAHDHYFTARAVLELSQIVRSVEGDCGHVDAAQFRDCIGTGRKLAIQILEFFDRIGFTRRVKDSHLLRNPRLFEQQAQEGG